MSGPLEGVRVLEVASWGVAPLSATVLSDWGAEVIKVERPGAGDPVRGVFAAFREGSSVKTDVTWQHLNRGKRAIGVDVRTPEGQAIVYQLAKSADVFVTSFPTERREEFGIQPAKIREVNPDIIYARATSFGPRGPDSDRAGHDHNTFWARSGAAYAQRVTADTEYPPFEPVGAFGDYITGLALAGGIAAALYGRLNTGQSRIVDNSLFGTGLWAMGYGIVSATAYARPEKGGHHAAKNPLSNMYRTADGRFICLALVQSDRWWPDFVEKIGKPELGEDPRFADFQTRAKHNVELIEELDEIFAERTLDEWVDVLNTIRGPWAPVQSPTEVHEDEQVQANEYLSEIVMGDGETVRVVSVPIQFDESSPQVTRAPEVGEHTEEILLEEGFTWEQMLELKDAGVIT